MREPPVAVLLRVHDPLPSLRQHPADPRVLPDLTASADVVLEGDDDALLIPREAVQENGGKSVVLVKQGEAIVPREVEIGAMSHTQVAVLAGLQPGEEVALHAPEKN